MNATHPRTPAVYDREYVRSASEALCSDCNRPALDRDGERHNHRYLVKVRFDGMQDVPCPYLSPARAQKKLKETILAEIRKRVQYKVVKAGPIEMKLSSVTMLGLNKENQLVRTINLFDSTAEKKMLDSIWQSLLKNESATIKGITIETYAESIQGSGSGHFAWRPSGNDIYMEIGYRIRDDPESKFRVVHVATTHWPYRKWLDSLD